MQVTPFESLLFYLENQFPDRAFTEGELAALGWPVPLHYLTQSGLRASGRGRAYPVKDLIAYARLHAIPCEGIVKSAPIRPAKILGKDTDLATGQIQAIRIAASYLAPAGQGEAVLAFLCPLCGNVHVYGAGDGYRPPHCGNSNPAFLRRDIAPLAQKLAPNWLFHLVEAPAFDLAGDLPRFIKSRLSRRQPQAGAMHTACTGGF